jgi:hypothetical protein
LEGEIDLSGLRIAVIVSREDEDLDKQPWSRS